MANSIKRSDCMAETNIPSYDNEIKGVLYQTRKYKKWILRQDESRWKKATKLDKMIGLTNQFKTQLERDANARMPVGSSKRYPLRYKWRGAVQAGAITNI
ncbi:hypothetical protein J6590_040418 [Homalodisca vitripennis]|nr:hypothetical protein J6590_040418 [Homalodisca vitripennis]